MKLINTVLKNMLAQSPNKKRDLVLKPISLKALHSKLKKGTVTFIFEKNDGNLRLAQGTLQMDKVPKEYRPLGVKEPTPLQINYFDLTKKLWRSMSSNTKVYIG